MAFYHFPQIANNKMENISRVDIRYRSRISQTVRGSLPDLESLLAEVVGHPVGVEVHVDERPGLASLGADDHRLEGKLRLSMKAFTKVPVQNCFTLTKP